ncbi:MAG: hypothetical protein QM783_18425 [Phycisphaerales bacterium]
MNKEIRLTRDALEQYRAFDASMQLELREHVVLIADDPLALLRRVFSDRATTRLVYEYGSECAHDIAVHLTFELNEHNLVLIDIRSFADGFGEA